VFVWVFIPAYGITIDYFGTDIVNGTCVAWGVYASYAAQIGMVSSLFVITYLLPLMLMIFCYFRIVCALKRKVCYRVTMYI